MDIETSNLIVHDTARIKRLFVEELEHPDGGNPDGSRLVETAEPRNISLIHKPGRSGQDAAKIRALKPGVGLKINPYEKIIEFRTDLQNKQGMSAKVLDMPTQSFRQLEAGKGIFIQQKTDSILIENTSVPQNTVGEGETLTHMSQIKRIKGDVGIELKSSDSTVIISSKRLEAGAGINIIMDENGIQTISSSKQLQEFPGVGCSLFNKNTYSLKRILFPPEYFTVIDSGMVVTVKPLFPLRSYPLSFQNGGGLLQNDKLRCLRGGVGCKISEKEGYVLIECPKTNVIEEMKITSNTLLVGKTKDSITVDLPVNPTYENVGNGVAILDGNKLRTLKGKGNCRVSVVDDNIEIGAEIQYTNTISSAGSLLSGRKIKAICCSDNLLLNSSADTINIRFPMHFNAVGINLIKKLNDGLHIKTLSSSGAIQLTENDTCINIHSESVKSTNPTDGSLCLLNNHKEVKCIKSGSGIQIKDKGNYIEVASETSLDNMNSLGHPLLDKRVNKVKCIKGGTGIDIKADQSSLTIDNTFSLNSVGDGFDLLASKNSIKKIQCGEGVVIENRGECLYINTRPLLERIEALEKIIQQYVL